MNPADESKDGEPAGVTSTFRHVRVNDDEAGQRIDNFLIKRCTGVPRSHVYRLIRKGEVRVDGKRIKQTRKLVAGEQVRIPPVQIRAHEPVHVPDRLAGVAGSAILYDHEDFLIVNKPAGIAVHGGSGLAFGFIDALRQQLDQPRLELAHRIDRATSGCLLIGRGLKNNRQLQDLFRVRAVEKRYLAVVAGQWPEELVQVDVPLRKNVEQAGERRVVVDPEGQAARTRFHVRQRFVEATLMDIELETGRMHQIRVHARHAGHALVGDSRYGDNTLNASFRQLGLHRLYLHSAMLSFEWQGQPIRIEAPVDPAWDQSMARLTPRESEP